jgi:mRNA interferase MazF
LTGSLIFPKRGEIWWVDFEPQIGSEIKKKRPAIIINSDPLGRHLPLKIVVPITDARAGKKDSLWHIPIKPDKKNKLSKDSVVDCFQIRCIAQERLRERLGEVSPDIMSQVVEAIALLIDYQSNSDKS